MKNKEIKYLLNEMKDTTQDYIGTNGCKYQDLLREEIDLLLSYIEQLEEENKYLKQLCQTQNDREYRSKFLKEFQKEHGDNVFPDYDEIYKRYDKLKEKTEQLEKDKKELKDGWQQEIYDKNEVLSDWLEAERKVNILQNNRDKAIEILGNYKHYSTPTEEQNRENEEIVDDAYNILKGDSDE